MLVADERPVVELPGPLGPTGGRHLADLIRTLPVDRSVEIRLPDAEDLPLPALAACVLLARRLRAVGADLVIVAGPGVAKSVTRARLNWLLQVQLPTFGV